MRVPTPDEFISLISNQKGLYFTSFEKNRFGATIGEKKMYIPPLTANIIHTGKIPFQTSLVSHAFRAPFKLQSRATEELPKEFNWCNTSPSDSTEISEIKKKISPIVNQMHCGSCWAFAISSALSDQFVVSKVTSVNPNCSPAYILGTVSESQGGNVCEGGIVDAVYQTLSKQGVASNHLVDYSVCSCSDGCSGRGEDHLNKNNDPASLSALFNGVGKYAITAGKYSIYYPKAANDSDGLGFVSIKHLKNENGEVDIARNQNYFKRQIYLYGPQVGCYIVYNNFLGGKFTQTNGVYIDTYDYNGDGDISPLGGHAVNIVGWGEESNVPDGKGGKISVPYWIVRNSWSDTWGNKGYWKHAMYPVNQRSMVDAAIVQQSGYQTVKIGGCVFSQPDRVETKVFDVSPQYHLPNGKDCLLHSLEFYTPDGELKTPIDPCSGIVCQNNGNCVLGSCICTSGYTGDRCENAPKTDTPTTSSDDGPNYTRYIIIVVVGVVILIALGILIYFLFFRKKITEPVKNPVSNLTNLTNDLLKKFVKPTVRFGDTFEIPTRSQIPSTDIRSFNRPIVSSNFIKTSIPKSTLRPDPMRSNGFKPNLNRPTNGFKPDLLRSNGSGMAKPFDKFKPDLLRSNGFQSNLSRSIPSIKSERDTKDDRIMNVNISFEQNQK